MDGAGVSLHIVSDGVVKGDAVLCGAGVTLVVGEGGTFAGNALLEGGRATLILGGGNLAGKVLLRGGGIRVIRVDAPNTDMPAGVFMDIFKHL